MLKIIATTGALLGPPWQAKENGYLIKPKSSSLPSLYCEPHCMYDSNELSRYKADYVITPIISQELPAYTLVDGMEKALKLAETLSASSIIPMNNGGLVQSGLLSAIVGAKGSEEEFRNLMTKYSLPFKLETVIPGEALILK